jgi:predicted secreted protein
MKLILILVILVQANVFSEEAKKNLIKKIHHITTIKKDDELEIKINPNEVEAIRLPARMGTGLSWRIKDKDDSIQEAYKNKLIRVKLKRKDGKKDKVQLFKEYQVFFLKPTASGNRVVTFLYKRHWDENDKPTRVVNIQFNVTEPLVPEQKIDIEEASEVKKKVE